MSAPKARSAVAPCTSTPARKAARSASSPDTWASQRSSAWATSAWTNTRSARAGRRCGVTSGGKVWAFG